MWKTNRRTGKKFRVGEKFTNDDIKTMIKVNQRINEKSKELHGFRIHVFKKMQNEMDKHDDPDDMDRIINKATELLAGFHYEQPFNNSNKRTGFFTLRKFLDRNGYRLKKEGIPELIELGKKWNVSWEDQRPQVYSEFREFLKKNIEPKV